MRPALSEFAQLFLNDKTICPQSVRTLVWRELFNIQKLPTLNYPSPLNPPHLDTLLASLRFSSQFVFSPGSNLEYCFYRNKRAVRLWTKLSAYLNKVRSYFEGEVSSFRSKCCLNGILVTLEGAVLKLRKLTDTISIVQAKRVGHLQTDVGLWFICKIIIKRILIKLNL